MKVNKLTQYFKRGLLGVALVVPVMFTAGFISSFADLQCTSPVVNSIVDKNTCSTVAANNSWLVWFNGHSRSTQFQYIDLFELIHGDKEQPTKLVMPNREG